MPDPQSPAPAGHEPSQPAPSGPGRLHPDRLLPADAALRSLARELFAAIAALPIVAVHGHVDAGVLADDLGWRDPASLLVSADHYVLRALHSVGTALDRLGRGPEPAPPEEVWQALCEGWPALRGSATGLWLSHELVEVFGVGVPPRPEDFALLAGRLADPAFRPRALYRRFGIEVLSTTDAVGDDFAAHARLQVDGYRVVPTVRPDALTDPTRPGWADGIETAGITSCAALLARVADARHRSVAAGAVATDHGHGLAHTEELGAASAEELFTRLVAGRGDTADAVRLAGHLLLQMGVMALDDGLVLQLHPGVLRDHDRPGVARYGADTGADFPVPVSFTAGLRPLLVRCGNEPGFRMVAFTVDETTWSRELAPMASYWPGLYLGAPWWFLDAPDAMARHFSAVVESAGYAKLSGFVDDTRAFCSIPARHDVARRAIAAHLARYVGEHRLSMDDAAGIARAYAYDQPRAVYRLP